MTKQEIITTKLMGGGSYLGLILGTITQDTTLMLSAISYLIGIVLGLITIYIKVAEYCKKNKQ